MSTTENLLEKLNPVIEIATQMLLNGVLSKNVIKHFTNKNWSLGSANNICELAIFRSEQLTKNKIK